MLYLITRISRITELLLKLFCLGLVMSCFLYINLNYSVHTLQTHYSTKNTFACCCSLFLHEKITLFNFDRERLCFQAFCMHINIHFGPLCQDNTITWRSIISARQDSLDLSCGKHHA